MATDLVGNAGENLRQNVLLAAETMADKLNSSKNDLDSDAAKHPLKPDMWQSVVHLSDHLCKNQAKSVIDLTNETSGKRYSNASVIEVKLPPVSKRSDRDNHNFDDTGDCISELIGHIGPWQVVWVAFLIIFQVPSAFHIFSFMFQAIERDFWCAIPPHIDTNISLSEWREISQPNGACSIVKDLEQHLKYGHFINASHNASAMEKCTRFEFKSDNSDATIQSEWNVVCDDATLLNVIEMCFLAGAAIGSLSSGTLSDEYGRRHTLMIVVALQALIGTSLALVKSLTAYMILRFALGFVSMSIVNISFVLTVEMVTGKWSSIIGTLDLLPLPLAYIALAGIAYVTRNWRHLQLIISMPWFGLLFFWYVLPESPRWLLAKGRIDELKRIIETAARWNKRVLPPGYEKSLLMPDGESSGSVFDLFKPEYLRTTLLLLVAWYALVLQYMAITLHIGEMGGNIYLITVYAGVFESVAILISIFTVTKFGIQKNIFYNILLAGLCLMYIAIFPNADWSVIVVLAMLGKSTTGVANAMIPAFTSFQYPPTLRTRAMGLTNFSAGFALISVPYIWLLKHVENFLPPLILGLCGLLGALVLFFIDDRTAMMMAAERTPAHNKKLMESQQQLGK